MKTFIAHLAVIYFLLCTVTVRAQTDSAFDHNAFLAAQSASMMQPKIGRLAIVGGATGLALASTYYYVYDHWWKDNTAHFHIDWGRDLEYANNVDKAAHFMGGLLLADLLGDGLQWSNVNQQRALVYSGLAASMVQFSIEIKDGYGQYWGYSVYDFLAGSAGSFYPLIQQNSRFFADLNFKASYWIKSRAYLNEKKGAWHDDYMNQTYWASFNPNRHLPEKLEKWWPDFLAISVGLSVDEVTYLGHGKGRHVIMIAPDIDLMALLKPKHPMWKRVVKTLNYIKFPAPAIMLTPHQKNYWLYF